MSKVTDIVTGLAEPLAAEQGVEIWDVEYVREAGQWFLRVYIDKEGIGINDCEAFSRALDPLLDEADPIPESYVFEVSSAGCERALKKPEHFARFIGSDVEVRLYQPVNNSKTYVGVLQAYEDGAVTVSQPAGPVTFSKQQVAQVRLHVVF